MKNFVYYLFIFVLTLIPIKNAMSDDIEKPKYEVLKADEEANIEIRKYESMIIAKVNVEGKRKESINTGFKLLADFIFGNNTTSSKVSMTAPVQQENKDSNSWQVSFVMPSKYSMENLPKPNNSKVEIEEIKTKKIIAIDFSGFNSESNVNEHKNELDEYIKNNDLKTLGSHIYAFYNPPWTLPFFRRNEIMIEIE